MGVGFEARCLVCNHKYEDSTTTSSNPRTFAVLGKYEAGDEWVENAHPCPRCKRERYAVELLQWFK